MGASVSISRESLDTRCENQEVTKGERSRTAHIKKPTSPSSLNQHSFVTHSFVYATIMIMKYTLPTILIFVSAVFAQQTSFPSQCISPCSGVLSISDSCANSTGYNFDADVVLAQEYLNCICASSNTGIMNSCLQCAQQAGDDLGGIVDAQQACASGTANLNSFTSQYGNNFTGIASDFSGGTFGSATATGTDMGASATGSDSTPATAATAKKTSAMPTQASSEAEIVRVSVYNMVLLGFAMVLGAYVL